MRRILPLVFLLSVSATAGDVPAGRWDVTSTLTDATIPGAPGFLVRMMRGKSRTERKCLLPGQGMPALLAPDPKARCTVQSQTIADGRYSQTLSCPQKRGEPMKIVRAGTFAPDGLTGTATMAGQTPKGNLRIVLGQRSTHVAGSCTG